MLQMAKQVLPASSALKAAGNAHASPEKGGGRRMKRADNKSQRRPLAEGPEKLGGTVLPLI